MKKYIKDIYLTLYKHEPSIKDSERNEQQAEITAQVTKHKNRTIKDHCATPAKASQKTTIIYQNQHRQRY